MLSSRRSFRTRIERQVVILFLAFCILPLPLLTVFASRLVESETLDMSRRHLHEFSKDYALDLITRIDVAAWELVLLGGRSGGAHRWVQPRGQIDDIGLDLCQLLGFKFLPSLFRLLVQPRMSL